MDNGIRFAKIDLYSAGNYIGGEHEMFEVIYMKAEFEPWWMFEGWEETIVSRHAFSDITKVNAHLNGILIVLREKYENETIKNDCFYAFWSENEKIYCDACDDDLQIYHGVMLMKEGRPTNIINNENTEISN